VVRLDPLAAVAGRTVSAEDGSPLAKVFLSTDGAIDQSDAEGWFRMEVPAGKRTLDARRDGYALARIELSLAAGQVLEDLEIRLERGSTLTGIVVDGRDGRPVKKASVSLGAAGGGESDGEGRFEIEHVATGGHEVLVWKKGFAPIRTTVEAPAREPLRLVLGQGGVIRGTVRDEKGRPVSGAYIWRSRPTDAEDGEGTPTDAKGVFRFDHVEIGPHAVFRVRVGGGTDFEMKQITVVEGHETVVDFGGKVAAEKATLTGRLLSRGKPVGMKAVVLVPVTGRGRSFKLAMSDFAGRFRVPGLEPGRYRVMVAGIDGVNVDVLREVDVSAGGEIEQDVSMEEGRLTGKVLRARDRKPVVGARVILVNPEQTTPGRTVAEVMDQFQGQTATRSDGSFTFENAPPGRHVLLAWADGLAPAVVEGVESAPEASAPVTVLLAEGEAVVFEVTDPDGAPIPAAAIFLDDAQGRYVMTGDSEPRTGPDGRVRLALAAGTYDLHVQADGRAPVDRTVDIRGNRTVAVTLEAGGTVVLTVTEGGVPVAGAEVRAYRPDGVEIRRRITTEDLFRPPPEPYTDANGRVELGNLPSGEVRLRVRGKDVEATVSPGTTVGVTVSL
jgi:hypothetical protein